MEHIRRGDIFYIKSFMAVGSEQNSGRPAVVVSNNKNNEHSDVVEIVYLTLKEKPPLPTHVKLDRGKCVNSTILCEQVTSVSLDRLGDYICRVPDDIMDKVDQALAVSIGIDYLIKQGHSETKQQDFPVCEDTSYQAEELIKTREELNQYRIYKELYDNLVDKMLGARV